MEPYVLPHRAAAKFVGHNHDHLRKMRDEDKKRIKRGEPLIGPPWIVEGSRYFYRVADLKAWMDRHVMADAS